MSQNVLMILHLLSVHILAQQLYNMVLCIPINSYSFNVTKCSNNTASTKCSYPGTTTI